MRIRFTSDGRLRFACIQAARRSSDSDDFFVQVAFDGETDAPVTIFGMSGDDAGANAVIFVKGLADDGTDVEMVEDSRKEA